MICDYEINFQHVYRYKTVSVRKITSNILLCYFTTHETRRDTSWPIEMEKGGGERVSKVRENERDRMRFVGLSETFLLENISSVFFIFGSFVAVVCNELVNIFQKQK